MLFVILNLLSGAAAQLDDQGLVNTDPRTIAVPLFFPNMIPTDVRGLTFSRTPQQVHLMAFPLPLLSTCAVTPCPYSKGCREWVPDDDLHGSTPRQLHECILCALHLILNMQTNL